jgi:hypothetical protein
MHCGVMVTGYNEGDWERLLAEDYSRPPAVSDARNMAIKLVPGGHPHHATAEAAANAAIAGDIAPLDVASIVLSSAKYLTRPGPKHPTDLIGVAHSPCLLHRGAIADRGYGWIHASSEKVADPVIARLIDKITVDPNPRRTRTAFRTTTARRSRSG